MNFLSADLNAVVAAARDFVVEWQHSGIDDFHLFIAMLSKPGKASACIADFNMAEWTSWAQNVLPATDSYTPNSQVAFTILGAQLMHHAGDIALKSNEKTTNTIHLLLALLSYNNVASAEFRRRGILFEDIAGQYLQVPVRSYAPLHSPSGNVGFMQIQQSLQTGGWKQKRAQDLLGDAYCYLSYYESGECIRICKEGLLLDPSLHTWEEYMVQAYWQQSDYQSAGLALQSLIQKRPGNLNYLLDLSYNYDVQGMYAESEVLLNDLLGMDSGNAICLNNKGFNLSAQEQYEEAVPWLEKAIAADAAYAYPYNNLGFVKHKLGESAEGLRLIDQSLELDKGNSFAYKNKGIVLMDLGKREEAARYFRLALRYGYTQKYGSQAEQLLAQLS